ncbi:FxsC protein [Streptomyces sp. GC420]|uniref:FxsC protein n=1 Tax=Streptomyces sp. GC420 TaxID=2697568 RepID=UPI001414D02C|nr:FxsC protein [Streptomyces sp. GC420]NBM18608.1 hypothetical protein [Streptomyces sp. GC420]
MSHFYLSHVRRVDDEWVAAFFRDLCAAVAKRVGRAPENVGVRGDSHSSDPQLDRLGRATTLVALLSPRYFSQSYCVAEWSYFQQRVDVNWSRTGRRVDAIVPVMWEPCPEDAADTGAVHPALSVASDAYRRDGVLHLLRLRARYGADYDMVVEAVADRVSAVRERLPEVHGFTSAGSPEALRVPARPPSRAVSFVMAAVAEHELPAERRSRQYYGQSPLDWSPYVPGNSDALVSLVKDTATTLDFSPTVLPLDDRAVEQVGTEGDQDRLVVLLVDAWAAGLREKQRLLAAVDERSPESTTVLEPRNEDDTETAESAPELDRTLDRTLPLLRKSVSEFQRWGLPDAEKFTAALRKALIRAQNDAMKSTGAERHPAPSADDLDTFPLLGRRSS